MFSKNKYLKFRDVDTIKDHLANERTLLAWIRTSIGIMAFGFVIEKFSFFLKEMIAALGKNPVTKPSIMAGYSSLFGIILVALGALLCILSFFKYKHIERQIEENAYQMTVLLDILLTLSVCIIGIFLVVILVI